VVFSDIIFTVENLQSTVIQALTTSVVLWRYFYYFRLVSTHIWPKMCIKKFIKLWQLILLVYDL